MAKILLVEDALDVGEILAAALEARHDVRIVHTCGDARQAMADDRIGLLIVDLVLPDGRGTDLADEATAASIPSIMMTGDGVLAEQLRQEGRQCLSKPFALADFLAIVQAHFGDGQ